jgi:hypothetical protein
MFYGEVHGSPVNAALAAGSDFFNLFANADMAVSPRSTGFCSSVFTGLQVHSSSQSRRLFRHPRVFRQEKAYTSAAYSFVLHIIFLSYRYSQSSR